MNDYSRCRLPPFHHQKIGVEALQKHPYFMLADEMGAGKTAQAIIAAQFLYEDGVIDRALVVAPAAVRDVWFDEELGELKKHLFLPANVYLFHHTTHRWQSGDGERMIWIIANYEFIRKDEHLDTLLESCGKKTLLILDESSAVKSYRAAQTKACFKLRKRAGRVVLLNGTPIANNPMDLFSQGNLMDFSVLECSGITHFRARYAEMGGYTVTTPWGSRPTQIVGWRNLDDLQKRFAPYVLRRLKKDCLDLPPVLPAVTLTATLDPATWKIYKEMRDEMVAWLQNATVSVAAQTITKILRLSQITSGFVGGVEAEVINELQEGRPDWLPGLELGHQGPIQPVQEVGREKLDVLLDWTEEQFENDPNLKLLIWCRFIPELRRLLEALQARFPLAKLGSIAGKAMFHRSHKEEREEALRLLDPRTAPDGPVIVGGTYGTGSLGLNLTACHTVVNCSFDYSLWKKLQSDARVDRPGQTSPVSYFDIIAVGPKGQRTIDHIIIKTQREKEEVATWTTSAWVQALTAE
jgi:hypothetical protein